MKKLNERIECEIDNVRLGARTATKAKAYLYGYVKCMLDNGIITYNESKEARNIIRKAINNITQ